MKLIQQFCMLTALSALVLVTWSPGSSLARIRCPGGNTGATDPLNIVGNNTANTCKLNEALTTDTVFLISTGHNQCQNAINQFTIIAISGGSGVIPGAFACDPITATSAVCDPAAANVSVPVGAASSTRFRAAFQVGNDAIFVTGVLDRLLAAPGTFVCQVSNVVATSVEFGLINAGPVITSSASLDVEENQTDVAPPVSASDEDDDDNSLRFSITGGADGGRFEIGTASGNLAFNSPPPDFENASDNAANGSHFYKVEVTAKDADGATGKKLITVEVKDVIEPPVIQFAISVPEEQPEVTSLTAIDPGAGGANFAKTGGADQDKFNIDGDGNLTFSTPFPDFENPTDSSTPPETTDGTYVVEVTITDSAGNPSATVVQIIRVKVTNVVEPGDPPQP